MPHRLSLTQMAAAVREKRVSPVELVSAHLAQIERVNPSINAFAILLEDQALAAARESESRQMRGELLSPLDGLPVTIKDSFDVAGLPTRCGSALRPASPAPSDAGAVALLRRAGAIFLGKTNTPELLRSYETDNAVTGQTRNPWDLARTPGGSSGGEAAAIAAHCSPGGIGSDGGGSIRMPAHFTGIVGFKPTHGRVPLIGHHPVLSQLSDLTCAAGPMARTVADASLLFHTIAAYDSRDPFSAPVAPLPIPATFGIGVMEQFLDVPVQPSIRDAVRRAASLFHQAGISTADHRLTGLENAPNVWAFFFSAIAINDIQQLAAGHEAEIHWTLREVLEKPPAAPTYEAVSRMLIECERLRRIALDHLDHFPILLMPACGITAFKHRERRWQLPEKSIGQFQAMMPLVPFNLLGFPAITVPIGFDESGLPTGVQLVARPFADELLLHAAALLEAARGPLPAPPLGSLTPP